MHTIARRSMMIRHTPSLLDEEDEEDVSSGNSGIAATSVAATEDASIKSAAAASRENPNLNLDTPPDESLSVRELRQRQQELLQQYQEIRAARTLRAQQLKACNQLQSKLQLALSDATYQHDEGLVQYATILNEQRRVSRILSQQQQWNVIQSDAFVIDCDERDGSVATINGLRLGAVTIRSTTATLTTDALSANGLDGSNNSNRSNHINSNDPANGRSIATLQNPPSTTTVSPPRANANAAQRFFPFGSSAITTTTGPISSTAGPPLTSLVFGKSGTTTASATPTPTASTAPQSQNPNYVAIPWREINAALGQVVLLLSTLEQSLTILTSSSSANSGSGSGTATSATTPIHSALRYELSCRGSTSRIGLRKVPASSITYYNLFYHSNDSSGTESSSSSSSWTMSLLFGPPDRQFNMAMTMLLDCVASMAALICERDRTVQIPYSMAVRQGTIGGLSIARFATTTTTTATAATSPATSQQVVAETWTRAMKYLLTNLKHMMAFKGVTLWMTLPLSTLPLSTTPPPTSDGKQ